MPKSEEKTKFTEPHLEITMGPSLRVDLSGLKEKIEAIKRSKSEMSSVGHDTIQGVAAEETCDDGTFHEP